MSMDAYGGIRRLSALPDWKPKSALLILNCLPKGNTISVVAWFTTVVTRM